MQRIMGLLLYLLKTFSSSRDSQESLVGHVFQSESLVGMSVPWLIKMAMVVAPVWLARNQPKISQFPFNIGPKCGSSEIASKSSVLCTCTIPRYVPNNTKNVHELGIWKAFSLSVYRNKLGHAFSIFFPIPSPPPPFWFSSSERRTLTQTHIFSGGPFSTVVYLLLLFWYSGDTSYVMISLCI